MTTQPTDGYPSAWTPRWIPKERDIDRELDDAVAKLSDRELQALLWRVRARKDR